MDLGNLQNRFVVWKSVDEIITTAIITYHITDHEPIHNYSQREDVYLWSNDTIVVSLKKLFLATRSESITIERETQG